MNSLPSAALAGLRVIEMGQLIAGPFAGKTLGDFASGDEPQREGQCTEAQCVCHAFMQGNHETGDARQALEPLDLKIDIEVTQQSFCGSTLRRRHLLARCTSWQARDATQLASQKPSAPGRQFQTVSPASADHPGGRSARGDARSGALHH